MPFREPSAPAPVRRVVHGPFPIRRGRLLFALLLLPVACFVMIGARESKLSCTRGRGDQDVCLFEEDGPLLPAIRRTFGPRDMVEVDVRHVASRRGSSERWDLVIVDARGVETVVASRDSAEELDRFVSNGGWLTDGETISIVTPAGRVAFVFAAILVLAGLGVAMHALKGAGRFVIELDPAHDALRVTRRTLGVMRGSPLDLKLGDVGDVVLERGPIPDALSAARQAPELGARLVLVLRDGTSVLLGDRMWRGGALHTRALDALRDALALTRAAPEPTPAAAASSTPARAWRTPAIVMGVVAVAGIAGSLVVGAVASSTDGTVEIEAQVRCPFQGLDLLPGGIMQTSLPPGDHHVSVFDPSVEGHWEDRTFHVEKGQTTHFVCR